MEKRTIKFDERFENFEHYLFNVRIELVNVFMASVKNYQGMTLKEVREKDPKVEKAVSDIDNFDESVKYFFGYEYDNVNHCYEYKGK